MRVYPRDYGHESDRIATLHRVADKPMDCLAWERLLSLAKMRAQRAEQHKV